MPLDKPRLGFRGPRVCLGRLCEAEEAGNYRQLGLPLAFAVSSLCHRQHGVRERGRREMQTREGG